MNHKKTGLLLQVQANVASSQTPGSRYYFFGNEIDTGYNPPKRYTQSYKLPTGLTCDGITAKCVLQLYYVTGNTCNPPGTPVQYATSYLPTCGSDGAQYPAVC